MSNDDRIAALEKRLQAAEDHLEILNLLSSYGPLADSCSVAEAAAQWAPGGGYNYALGTGGTRRLEAPEPLGDLWRQQGHVELTQTGSAHITMPPKVSVKGDAAEAVGYRDIARL